MSVRALLTITALLLQLLPVYSSLQGQSACKVIWVFRLPCTEPVSAVVNLVKVWGKKKCSGSQETCMYEIMKESPTSLEIRHTSPSTRKTTDINFEFNPPAAPNFCKMSGLSKSKNATSPNDYCLLYNLIDGSGLTEALGYKEICNKAMCPAKESATCNNDG